MKIIKLMIIFIIITPLSVFANLKYANLNQSELRRYCGEKVFSQVDLAYCLEKILMNFLNGMKGKITLYVLKINLKNLTKNLLNIVIESVILLIR